MSSMTTGEQAFFNLLNETPRPEDRRRSFRTRVGTLASVRQIVNAEALAPVHVLLTDASDGGVGLRSAISLVRGGLYRIEIEEHPECAPLSVKVVSSRRRRDGSYDIGTRYV